jgi:hypothetical protein
MTSKPYSRNSILSALIKPQFKVCAIFVMAAFVLSSCGHVEPKPKYTITEAQKKFEDKCLKDFNLHVRTHQVGHTLWIYLPTKDPIFDYEVQKDKHAPDNKDALKFVVNFSDGKYQNELFSFEYDIVDKKKDKEESVGFNSSYTDAYIKNQNNLFTTIYEIFLNAKAKDNEIAPVFFVVVITDIKKGIETRLTFYLEDFIRAWAGDLPNDEYMKRVLSDQKGSPTMVGDETGSHLKYTEMTMGEFLAKQILNRVHYKFQYSDFPPKDTNVDNTIIGIVSDTLRYYKFKAFTNVRLSNLRTNKKYLFDQSQLENFGEEKPKGNEGKLIHIRFKDGKPEFNEDLPSDQPTLTSDAQSNQSL